MTARPAALLAVLAVALGGCLPSSQRQNSRAISPADSASAAFAETVPVDTLEVVWTARAPTDDPMPIPTTISWLGDALAVVETQGGTVRRFSDDGAYVDKTEVGAESFPYAAGARGDTLVVFARGPGELLWVVPGRGVVRRVPAPAGASSAFAAPGGLAVRVGGGPDGATPEVLHLDERGEVVGRHAIPGAPWRALGFLRPWGDTLLALSGYRPVVDLVALADTASAADTLMLVGFASPQMPRSAQFERGEVAEPPLLLSSAAAVGDRLFVLNLRSDHVRVDVYGRDGRLRRVLVSPGPWRPLDDVALDLVARERGGGVELAVLRATPPGLLREPDAQVVLYRWTVPPAEAVSRQ